MIADAFNCFLSGVARSEESNASTSQLYNPRTRRWSKKLIGALDLPERLFPPIVSSGTRLAVLKTDLARETGLPAINVIASCSHDTAAAVAAVPVGTNETATPGLGDRGYENWAYLSSGTWSLMGVELRAPMITDSSRKLNFTNEIGYGGSVRLLKNISGMWLVQECRREWTKAGQEFDYATLAKLAAAAPAFVSIINPADTRFLAPPSMPEAIATFCRETNQPVPTSPGAFIRCALESLALLYRRTLRQIEQLIAKRIERLHIVGGGSRNTLLNQFTADALRIPVLAGPAEATAAGNVLIQAITLSHLPSLAAARDVVRMSFDVTAVHPESTEEWERQHCRFERLLA
jgi:rhamnulokinase